MRRAFAFLPLLFLLAVAVVQAAEPEFPPLTGRVNDRAGLLSERDQRELEAALAHFETETTNQIVVATLELAPGASDRRLRLPARAPLGHRPGRQGQRRGSDRRARGA